MHFIAKWCNELTNYSECWLNSSKKYKSKQAEGPDVYMSEKDNLMPA
jgi:hypothetical protein